MTTTHRSRRGTAVLALSLCAALTLTACGKSPKAQGTDSAATTGATSAGAGASSAGTPGAGASKSDVSKVILNVNDGRSGSYTANFNPLQSTQVNSGALGPIYETLFFFNQVRSDPPKPELGTAYSWADGGKTLNLTIRQGVKWSDGQPFTADDVAYSFQVLKQNKALNQNGIGFDTITATDATHVKLTFTAPSYSMLWYIAGQSYMVPKHIFSKMKDVATDLNSTPVGTGPFVLQTFAPQGYVLAKNPNYWQSGKPEIGGLRFKAFSGNDSSLTSLIGGQIDWEGGFIADIDKVYASKSPSNKYINTPQFTTVLVPNLSKFPGNDPVVREAINLSLDRDSINKKAFSGLDTPANGALLLTPRDASYLDPSVKSASTLTTDVPKAQSLLAAAGWAKGSDGIYAKDGKKLSFTVEIPSGYSDWVASLQVMQQELKSAGIDLKPTGVSNTAWNSDLLSGNFVFAMNNLYGGPTPYYLYNTWLNSANAAPNGNNSARYSNPVVDKALAAIAATDDPAAQQKDYATIQTQVVKDLPYIPVGLSSSLTEYRDNQVRGWPTSANLYALPAPWAHPDLGIVAANLTGK